MIAGSLDRTPIPPWLNPRRDRRLRAASWSTSRSGIAIRQAVGRQCVSWWRARPMIKIIELDFRCIGEVRDIGRPSCRQCPARCTDARLPGRAVKSKRAVFALIGRRRHQRAPQSNSSLHCRPSIIPRHLPFLNPHTSQILHQTSPLSTSNFSRPDIQL
jgi:hypothetical protein